MGGFGEETLATLLFENLKAKGLARDSEDGKFIRSSRLVRSLILVLLSQVLRPHGEKLLETTRVPWAHVRARVNVAGHH